MKTINIAGLNKADVLVALYNNSKTVGLGNLHATQEKMNTETAQKILDSGQTYFDYLNGRVMKIDLEEDEMFTALYDRDNGQGAAYRALSDILEMKK